MKWMAEGRHQVGVAAGRQHAPDLAHNLLGIPDMFQDRITFHALKGVTRKRQLLRIGSYVDPGHSEQVQVYVARHEPARSTDVEIPPAEWKIRRFGPIHDERSRRLQKPQQSISPVARKATTILFLKRWLFHVFILANTLLRPRVPHGSSLVFGRTGSFRSAHEHGLEYVMPLFQPVLWLCVAAYGVHILEEFVFDWQNWALNVLGLPVRWSDFYITNALVIVLGIVAAEVGPVWPAIALSFPALMLINATFFHVAPFAWTRGRFSPGLITAVLLFFPIGIEAIRTANVGGGDLAIAFGIGAALMATPIVFLKLKVRPYFDQTL
jgi:Protein of unknown function with HXXEE motif